MTKVLIIEDNNDIRENLVDILCLAGYEVSQANNGRAGVEIANTIIPDIILCDIMMPELDGYGVLFLLHKNELTSRIPFIFITAKSDRTDFRKGMEMGADDYLTKPFDDMELLNAIDIRLKRKHDEQDFYSHSLDKLGKLVPNGKGLNELAAIIAERKSRMFRKNQVVHYEGDRAIGIYLILSGKVKTVKMSEDGRELMTGIYEPDDFLGVNMILSDAPHTDTATAMEDSQLCFFPIEQFEALLQNPEIAGKFIGILSSEVRDRDAHLLQLAYQSVRKRIAEAILRLFRQNNSDGETIAISRDNLAAMSGTASETVSRTLTEFRNEGLIDKKGSSLTILDFSSLVKMRN
ncbi:response regulator [Flavobacterium sp. DGU11]|uniref:Response regulator n=1 Tax=Flavobacterium arundinis TaxID=3139143 RepID=A0ABU9HXR8_9FLAO